MATKKGKANEWATPTISLDELKAAAARRKQQREWEGQQKPGWEPGLGITVYELLDAGFVYVEVERIEVMVFNDELRAHVPVSPTYMVHRSVLAGATFSIDSHCVNKFTGDVRLNMGGGYAPLYCLPREFGPMAGLLGSHYVSAHQRGGIAGIYGANGLPFTRGERL